jgi:hypothetical protein
VIDALRMHVEPALRGAPMLLAFEGWNDAGEAASSAVRYVEEAIRAVPLAEIDCEEFFDFTVRRPALRLDDSGARVIDWPKARFRYGPLDGSRELVTGVGIEPHLRWRAFCDLMAGLVRRLRVERVVMLGAYLADVVYSRPVDVTGFANSPELLEELGVAPSSYQGPTGIVGVLSDRLQRDGVEVLSFWAGLPHYISAVPNPRGSLALIQKLSECIDVKLDLEPLRREAAAFEERISALVASDPELTEYVRQLKRREFAQ